MARHDHRAMARRVRVAQVLLVVIVVVGALLVGQRIVSGSVFSNPYRVVVDLPAAAGLHDRSDVSYRGQHIGLVTDVRVTATGVQATLEIDEGVRISRDTELRVADLSAVGEQYVDFRPRSAQGPYLTDGSVIHASQASLPIPTWQVLDHTRRLLERVDLRDLATIGNEINAMFGRGDVDLPGLAGEVGRTVSMLQGLSPTVFSLLRNARTPLSTMADLAPQVRNLVRNSRSITVQLRRSNPVIARLIDQGNVLIPVVSRQFASAVPVLVMLLDDGTPVATMAREHLPGLLHWYRWAGPQLHAMAESTRGRSGHVILVLSTPRNCRYGPVVSPFQRDVSLPLTARCTTVAPLIQQRGSQYIPHP